MDIKMLQTSRYVIIEHVYDEINSTLYGKHKILTHQDIAWFTNLKVHNTYKISMHNYFRLISSFWLMSKKSEQNTIHWSERLIINRHFFCLHLLELNIWLFFFIILHIVDLSCLKIASPRRCNNKLHDFISWIILLHVKSRSKYKMQD